MRNITVTIRQTGAPEETVTLNSATDQLTVAAAIARSTVNAAGTTVSLNTMDNVVQDSESLRHGDVLFVNKAVQGGC